MHGETRINANPMTRQRKTEAAKDTTPHETKFLVTHDAKNWKLKEAESIGRRRKLVLPTAQAGQAESKKIVKIGQARENAKALAGATDSASGRLLSDYEGLENARFARTYRTALQCQSQSLPLVIRC
jgi:pre-mRNA-splicing factor CDC5/CEF1